MKLNIVWYKINGSTVPAAFVFSHRKLMEYPLSRSKQSLFSKKTKQQLQPMLEPITFRTESQLLPYNITLWPRRDSYMKRRTLRVLRNSSFSWHNLVMNNNRESTSCLPRQNSHWCNLIQQRMGHHQAKQLDCDQLSERRIKQKQKSQHCPKVEPQIEGLRVKNFSLTFWLLLKVLKSCITV